MHNGIASLSLVETIRLIVRVLAETAIRLRNKEIAFRLKFGLFMWMKKHEPHMDGEGRYLNVQQAAEIVVGVCQKTMWNWANAGETKFGFKLRTKRVPVEHHRYHRLDEAGAKNPRKDRILILEADVLALKEILETGGRTQPGPWTDVEKDILGAKARAVTRQKLPVKSLHQ